MSRYARAKSESGFYHILLRGVGQQNIFEDEEDKKRFLDTLVRFKREMKFEVHAYCLMDNHVHLLVKDIKNEIDRILKKIAVSYVYYFNYKYERVGHLFQDRFISEAIEDDSYYLMVLRYIHQNPYKAGISRIENYRWSSYSEYINKPNIIDINFALELIGSKSAYVSFMSEVQDGIYLDITDQKRVTDDKAREIIKNTFGISNVNEIQKLDRENRDIILEQLKRKGLSIRQISRLTGINRGVVCNAKLSTEPSP